MSKKTVKIVDYILEYGEGKIFYTSEYFGHKHYDSRKVYARMKYAGIDILFDEDIDHRSIWMVEKFVNKNPQQSKGLEFFYEHEGGVYLNNPNFCEYPEMQDLLSVAFWDSKKKFPYIDEWTLEEFQSIKSYEFIPNGEIEEIDMSKNPSEIISEGDKEKVRKWEWEQERERRIRWEQFKKAVNFLAGK